MKNIFLGNEIVGEIDFVDPLKNKKEDYDKKILDWVDGITEII